MINEAVFLLQFRHDRPFSSAIPSIHNYNLRSTEDPLFEADLTVDEGARTMSGRVAATDGRVFLVAATRDASGQQVWIEVDVDNRGEGEDMVELVSISCRYTYYCTTGGVRP